MFWADRIAKELQKSTQHVNDAKTPSGKIHVGSLRGVIIHDLIFRSLKDLGVKASYTYIIDDHDPMDSLPVYLDQKKYAPFMGTPLNKIPSPDGSKKSFARYFADEFIAVFEKLAVNPEIIWAWDDLYLSGKMDKAIKIALDNGEKIQDIYQEVSGSKKKETGWYPFQVICQKCGKLGTTRVSGWDGNEVTYDCLTDLVKWAQGCGHHGKVSPFSGTGKLPWKVEWPAVWFTLGIDVEGEGKDLASRGGARDTASEIARQVFKITPPHDIPYEHFLIGGKKMSTSKGFGASASEMTEILPPEILRFLMVKTRSSQAIDFSPEGMTIPNLFDEYDRYAKDWLKDGRKSDFGRIFELSQIAGTPEKKINFPRFRDVATFVQMPGVDLEKQFADSDPEILNERVKYAKIWLDRYAPGDFIFKITEKVPEAVKDFSLEQKQYLNTLIKVLEKEDLKTAQDLEKRMYEIAKNLNFSTAEAFKTIYLSLLGKTHGPRAADIIFNKKEIILERFKEVASL